MHNNSNVKIIETSTAKELQNSLQQLDLLIATRMHPTILASTRNVPFVSIIYDHKQEGFLSDLHLEYCGLSVNDISFENLLSKIMFVLQNKVKIKEQMNNKIEVLKNSTQHKICLCIKHVAKTIRH